MNGRPSVARIAVLCALAFLILAAYEVARDASESLFLSAHSAEELPRVWVLVAIGVTGAVALYNRFAARLPLARLFRASILASAAVLVAVAWAAALALPGAVTAVSVCQDVYIVVLIESFWSLANTVFDLKSARWIYGLFLACGSLGSIVGAWLAEHAAPALGTLFALGLQVPLLAGAWVAAVVLGRVHAVEAVPAPSKPRSTVREGVRVLRESRYLGLMLLLVVAIQLVITLVDYRFKALAKIAYPAQDARTAAIAGVYGRIATASLALQVLTGPVLVLLKVQGALLLVPLLNAAAVAALAVAPGFAAGALAKTLGKVLDYSVYRAAKEMLYIPLDYAEKTQGKALIDMFGYRVSKGGAALLLNGLLAIGAVGAVDWMTVGWAAVWLGLTVPIVRRWRRRTTEAVETERAAA